MLMTLLTLIYLIFFPAALMLLARRWTWIDKVSPMSLLYIIGLAVANFTPFMQVPGRAELVSTLGSLCIPIAIPLMLMSCNLTAWNSRTALRAFLSGLIAVLAMSVAGFFLFRGADTREHFAQVAAVSVGIYTGGIPNMGAIAQGVGMDNETYLYLTSYDLIVTGLYLVFVIFLGKPVFRRLLPLPRTLEQTAPAAGEAAASPAAPSLLVALPATLLIAAISYLLSRLFPESLATPMLILILTTLSILAALLFGRCPRLAQPSTASAFQRRLPSPFTLGLFFVYLFCFSIANSCDVRTMNLAGSLNILWYILFVVFGSLVLQILFAKLLHLDGDSVLVTSVALINSPPFVPLVAALLGNRDCIVLGITVGLLGYMLGNYLGIGISFLLAL